VVVLRVDNDDSDDDAGGADADELYLAHVVSTKAHARLLNVDPSEALAMSGVVDFVSYKDVPVNNSYSPLYLPNDEETVFAVDTVGDYLIGRLLTFLSIQSRHRTMSCLLCPDTVSLLVRIGGERSFKVGGQE